MFHLYIFVLKKLGQGNGGVRAIQDLPPLWSYTNRVSARLYNVEALISLAGFGVLNPGYPRHQVPPKCRIGPKRSPGPTKRQNSRPATFSQETRLVSAIVHHFLPTGATTDPLPLLGGEGIVGVGRTHIFRTSRRTFLNKVS